MALLDDKGLEYFVGKLTERFAPKSHTHTKSQITDFPKSMPANGGNSTTVNGHSVNSDVPAGAKFTDTTYSVATASSNGLMTAADKAKLDGIASNANNYSHPTSAGNKHIPAGGSAGQILRWSADGTAPWGVDNNTTYSIFKGASSSAAGGSGLVPPPAAGSQSTKYLRADGTWTEPPNTTYANATKDTAGLMTAADKSWMVLQQRLTNMCIRQTVGISISPQEVRLGRFYGGKKMAQQHGVRIRIRPIRTLLALLQMPAVRPDLCLRLVRVQRTCF